MPNWSQSCYIADGDKQQIKRLHGIMLELEDMKSPGLHDNDFGAMWLGNLVIKLGGDWEKIYCRGYWNYLELKDDHLIIDVEAVWSEPDQFRHFIESKFPGIKLYYQCIEEGQGIFTTNDSSGVYFPDRYYFWVEDEDTEYYESLESLTNAVENITGSKHLTTLSSCKKALESFSRKHHHCCYTLEEFTVIDD